MKIPTPLERNLRVYDARQQGQESIAVRRREGGQLTDARGFELGVVNDGAARRSRVIEQFLD